MNRREFVTTCACGFATFARRTLGSQAQGRPVRLRLRPERTGPLIPPDFLGLGYETASVADRGLLAANNRGLIGFVRRLSSVGVIRVGGNTSDFAIWSAKGAAVSAPKQSVINQAVVGDLGGFLRATGWKLIWGLNLGRGTPEMAAEEAAALASAAGDALLAFQIGNEPDLFGRNGHRPSNYDYPEFYDEFKRYVGAVRGRLPGAPMAGPDAATRTDWVVSFARDEGSRSRLLTHHFYEEGPPQNPASTLQNLLKPRGQFSRVIEQLRATSLAVKVPYRIVETNSCFGGGKAGVSDTFASALWGLDLMFELAAAGGAGLNIETGVNHLGWISKYTPIDRDEQGNCVARPLYYGMLAFALASRGQLLAVDSEASGINFRAYAVSGEGGRVWVTMINKDESHGAEVTLESPRQLNSGELIRLTAPALDSKDEVSLGGSMVTSDGQWSPKERESLRASGNVCKLQVPAGSALVVELAP
ncbi:MAG TPA: glycosyl hydrolase family 79 C-terminal domain-containing protein [Terriglobia bacterium]